ncbi:major facilitator superfamily domain-containing protein 9-like isoform X1 [Liolophura sinensis]|uniref:major facilitator superfamily domain-containing protein 9-like isoform X1 n=1 Tax=Liolophura sinensis TaxID=3198878 RepID=UPI003158EE33
MADSSATQDRQTAARNQTVVVCLVGFLDLFGVSMIMPLIQTHAKHLGASPAVAGLVGSVYGFLQLFSSPIMGKCSDLVGHRLALMVSLALSGGGYILLGLSTSIVCLALARIPSGLFKHSQTISKAYLAEVIPPEKRALVYGRFNAFSSIGFIVGPTVGGHLAEVSSSGFFWVGLLAGSVFLTSSAIVCFCLPPEDIHCAPAGIKLKKTSTTEISIFMAMKNIFSSFANVNWKSLWDLFLVSFLVGFASIMPKANFTRMMSDRFQTTPKMNGYIISFGAVFSAGSSFAVGRIARFYQDDGKLFCHAVILNFLGLMGMVLAPNLPSFIILQTLLSLSSAIYRVVVVSLMVESGGQAEAGGLMGLNQSLMAIARTLSPMSAGVLLEVHSVGPVMGSCICVGLALIVMATQFHKQRIKKKEN